MFLLLGNRSSTKCFQTKKYAETSKRTGACFSTFRAYFGRHNSLYIFETARLKAIKLRNPLGFSYINNILKDQLLKTRGLQFEDWFSGPKSSRDLRETTPRPESFGGRVALTSVNSHRNVLVSILLNQWLALTMLRVTVPRLSGWVLNSGSPDLSGSHQNQLFYLICSLPNTLNV